MRKPLFVFRPLKKTYEVPHPRHVRRCAPVPSCLEHFAARPKNLKHSHLIDLFQGDHFNSPANEFLERVAGLKARSKSSNYTSYHSSRAEWKAWQRTTHHKPQHDGTASPLLTRLPNVSYYEADKKLRRDGRTRVVHVTADAKTAFDQLPMDAPKKFKLKKGDPLFDDQWLEQRAIEEREEVDLDMNADAEPQAGILTYKKPVFNSNTRIVLHSPASQLPRLT